MILHEDRKSFEEIIIQTSNYFNIDISIVEKDYYVTIMLKQLVNSIPNIIFRGGTSLSKCYHLVERFSEDIDLNIETSKHPTDRERKLLSNSIKNVIHELNFKLLNDTDIKSRKDFNRYIIDYDSLFYNKNLKSNLIIETSLFIKSFPCSICEVSSYIYEYMSLNGYKEIIDKCGLLPFKIKVQSLERTFIDKLFAVADYYLSNEKSEHSRHLYDLFKIKNHISFDYSFKKLFYQVKDERKAHKKCLSAQDNISLPLILSEIINNDYYKDDFEGITKYLLFEEVEYDSIITVLKDIVEKLQKLLNIAL